MTKPCIISVCIWCRSAGVERENAEGKAMFGAIAKAAEGYSGIVVRPTQCLSVCDRVCTVSISGEDKYTFLFGDLDPEKDASAVVEMAEACAAMDHGFVPWKERPECLRKGIIARVPPPRWSPDDGGAPA
jgi:predicted metal-binding protein